MRTRRTPFYGMPEDLALLPESERERLFAELPPDWMQSAEAMAATEVNLLPPMTHPDAVEKGIELPLGFVPHRGENRRQRREAVAKWTPPADAEFVTPDTAQRVAPIGDKPRMPTRRELWAQRQRQRRGTLDPELRRLQRRRAQTK
jgi:hypothetical protein